MRKLFLFIIFSIGTIFSGFSQNNNYEVISLGSQVNSSSDEQNPVLSPDGTRLFFTISKHPDNIGGTKDLGDIWYSELDSTGNWSVSVNAGAPLNNKHPNAIIGFFNNGKGLYLLGHYEKSGKKSKTKGISISYLKESGWSFPQSVDIRYFKNYSDYHDVTLSFDRRIMLHSLESYNSRGAEDIYVSFRKADGTWTDIQNLGSVINTNFQELTPFLAADNKTLFFSSNGHGGQGSFDLYMTERLDDSWKNWSVPKNLGSPINTPGRELYYHIIPESEDAFFCSTQNSDGYGDIKKYKLLPEDRIVAVRIEEELTEQKPVQEFIVEKNNYIFRGKLLDSKSNEPIAGKISIHLVNGVELATIESDSNNGEYRLEIASQNDFLIRINAKGYLSGEERLNMSEFEDTEIYKDFKLEPLEIGKTYKLDHILFFRGTADLIDTSYVQLDLVVRMMLENPDINIELYGHTDNQGNAKKNVILSQDRVDVVKQYLVDHSIDFTRVTGKGLGGSRPIASNASERTRQLNRRVEFVIKDQ